jgi:hypothetical protein
MYQEFVLNAHFCVFKITIFVEKIFFEKKRRQKLRISVRRTTVDDDGCIPGCETVHIVPDVGLLDVLQHRLLALIQFKERQTITGQVPQISTVLYIWYVDPRHLYSTHRSYHIVFICVYVLK